MPIYTAQPPALLNQNTGVVVWSNELVPTTPAASSVSQAIALQRDKVQPNCLSVEIAFAGNPGTFAVDLEVADTNADANYVTKATLNTGLNASFVGRIEATNLVAKFARLKMVMKTNAVNVTARMF